jgi:hypothetical protein
VRDALRPEAEVEQVAGIGVLRDQAQRLLLAAPADEDRRVGAAQALRDVEGAVELVVLPGIRALVVRPHLEADLQRFLEPLEPLTGRRERHPEGTVLSLVPGGPDAQPGPSAGEDVEGGDGLGQHTRVAVGHAGDEGAQLDRAGLAGRERQRGVALEHVELGRPDHADLEEVVHHPEADQPRVLGVAGDPPEGGSDGGRRIRPGEVGDLES